jgi:hypothetical protein
MTTRYRFAIALLALGAMTPSAAASGDAPAGWTKASQALAESCEWKGAESERRSFLTWRVSAPADRDVGRSPGRSSLPTLTCEAGAEEILRTGRCVGRARYSNALILDTPHGELEGINAGEWGGALIWRGVGQTPMYLLHEPIIDIHATKDGALAFGGLNHLGGRRGAVWRVDIGPDRRASAQLALRLFTAPGATSVGRNGSAIVATTLGVIRVTPRGTGEELFRWSPKVPPMARPGERHPLVKESQADRSRPSGTDYSWQAVPGGLVVGGHSLYSIVEVGSGTLWATTTPSASELTSLESRISMLRPALLVRFDIRSSRSTATFFIPPNCRIDQTGAGPDSCRCEPD